MGNMTLERNPSQVKVARLLEAMRTTPMHSRQVSELLFINMCSAARYLRRMHGNGLIHISAWTRVGNGASPVAVYSAGYGRDARRPKPVTADPSAYERKRYQRMKKDPEAYAVFLSKARTRMREAHARKHGQKRDPLVAALFGGMG